MSVLLLVGPGDDLAAAVRTASAPLAFRRQRTPEADEDVVVGMRRARGIVAA